MIIVKATTDSEAGTMPPEELIAGYTLIQVKTREEARELGVGPKERMP